MKFFAKRIAALLTVLATMASAEAQTIDSASDAEIQGRALVEKILSQQPDLNFTNTGVLNVQQKKRKRLHIPVQFQTVVNPSGWTSIYSAELTNAPAVKGPCVSEMTVVHSGNRANTYNIRYASASATEVTPPSQPSGNQTMIPFAGSDFWVCDLGLEFFHWPQQKIVKKEFHRQCACMVLESTNPNPSTNSYSRIVSWIDEESFGIVDAYAYDFNGAQLKHFYPKSLEKVNGQYQVTSMYMENVQTDSRSIFDFDVNK